MIIFRNRINRHYFKYILRVSRFYLKSNKRYRINKFKKDFGYYPDLCNPSTFNEKILYRMVMPTNKKALTCLADKLQARKRVEQIDGSLLPSLYGVFESVDEICLSRLPDKFVIKCNHDSGSYIICTDKSRFNLDEAKNKLSHHLKMNMYYKTREWQYRDIKPCIICEEYIDTTSSESLGFTPVIYRVHCFDSDPAYTEVEYTDSAGTGYTNIYDAEWNVQSVQINGRKNIPLNLPCPEKFPQLLSFANQLSKGLDYCRVDMYLTAKGIYFSEFTFSPNNGREKFYPRHWDIIFGARWGGGE